MVVQRNWLDESAEERTDIFNQISEFIIHSQGTHDQVCHLTIVGRALTAMVEVFARSYKSPDGVGYSPGEVDKSHIVSVSYLLFMM